MAVKARGRGCVFLQGTSERRAQTISLRGSVRTTLAYHDGPERIVLQTHHHPEAVATADEVPCLGKLGRVLNLDGLAEAEGHALLLTHSLTRVPALRGTKRSPGAAEVRRALPELPGAERDSACSAQVRPAASCLT
jgi:hypothetical protein